MLAAQLPASSFKNITGKDPFSILKAKSIYDHAHNTSRQIFGIKDSLHDLGYERDTHSEMFDLLDGMARNIITVNNMRYNNRNKQMEILMKLHKSSKMLKIKQLNLRIWFAQMDIQGLL